MTGSSHTVQDEQWIQEALALASLGEGAVEPNPMVGCLIVKDGKKVGAGWHVKLGEAHAETTALKEAGTLAEGATLYVNLEPCAHHGRTPPCIDQIIKAKISHVVASTVDPDPRVSGAGFDALREAGITVSIGCKEQEALKLNAPFFHWHQKKQPWVTAKAAITLDGQVAAAGGSSQWISNKQSRLHAHRLRQIHQAIWIGAQTYRQDHPSLDARIPGCETTSKPAYVWTRSGEVPHTPHASSKAKFFLVLPHDKKQTALTHGWSESQLVLIEAAEDGLTPQKVIKHLSQQEISSVLVEGGGATIRALLEAQLINQLFLYSAPKMVGSEGATPWIPGLTANQPDQGWVFHERQRWSLNEDLLRVGHIQYKR